MFLLPKGKVWAFTAFFNTITLSCETPRSSTNYSSIGLFKDNHVIAVPLMGKTQGSPGGKSALT